MQRYWQRVSRRAAMEAAASLGLNSREQIVIRACIAIAVLIGLVFLGSEDASHDELVMRAVAGATIILLFPLLYLWKLVTVPSQMEAEAETEKKALIAEIERRPHPHFSIVRERDKICLRIDNDKADATFTVKISFPNANTYVLPENPVHAQWFDYSKDTSRFIQSSGYDRIILFSIDMKTNVFLKTLVFTWISDGHQFERNSTSWAVTQNSGAIPPNGEMEVFISSEPPMQGGSKVLRLEYEGDKISVIKGEVQLPQ